MLHCASKDDEVVEYTLSHSLSPALIAEYQTQLPDKNLLQATSQIPAKPISITKAERQGNREGHTTSVTKDSGARVHILPSAHVVMGMNNSRTPLSNNAATHTSMPLAEEHQVAEHESPINIASDQNKTGPCNINHSLPTNTEAQTSCSSFSLENRQERLRELALLTIELYQTSKRLKDAPIAQEEAA